MRPMLALYIGLLLDVAVAHIWYIPLLYIYQCMLFYLFGKEMIMMPWLALGFIWYIPVYGVSWWVISGYICIAYLVMYVTHTYVIIHPFVYTGVVWLLLMLYLYAVQLDVPASWGALWTQMVIFANILIGNVLRHMIRQGE